MFNATPLTVDGSVVTLRPWTPADQAFVQRLYGSTRESELAQLPWSPEQKQQFVAHQFAAQDKAYRANYPAAEFLIVEVDRAPAGRLYLYPTRTDLRIMDIALLPPFRNRGIGTALLRQTQIFAAERSQRVSIHVETFNPARHLYERLGFKPVAKRDEVYILMEWAPPGAK